MKKQLTALGLAIAIVLTFTACDSGVPQEEYDALQEKFDALNDEYKDLKKAAKTKKDSNPETVQDTPNTDTHQTDSPQTKSESAPAETDTKWKELYTQFIAEMMEYGDTAHEMADISLIYINDDDIPELMFDWGFTAGGGQLLTVSNGELDTLYVSVGGVAYIERENIFIDSGGHMGYYFDNIYCIQDGKFVELHNGNRFDVDGYDWTWDGNAVSESEYNSIQESAVDISRLVFSYENVFSIDEIFDVIENW